MSLNTASSTHLLLWDYVLELYAKPEAADCCLQLQDTYGVNVNLALWCVWLEARQIELTVERLAAAVTAIGDWDRSYVQVLRQLRRQMKMEFAQNLALVASVRERIKQTELSAEKQEHIWLEGLAASWSPEIGGITSGKNLSVYLNSAKVPQSNIEQAIAVLIR